MATTIQRQFNFKGVLYAPGDEAALDVATTAAERSGLEALGFLDDGVTPGAIGGIPSVSVANIVIGDVAIGAVEVKDGTTDARAAVKAATTMARTDVALAVKDHVTGDVEGAAITTDANGTLQQYLRGLVTLVAAKIGITVADGDDVAVGATTDEAVSTDADGTVSAKLRGLVKILADVYVSASHWLKVQIQAGENFMGFVGGTTTPVIDSFTRPADTNTYAAGDGVAAATTDSGTTPLRALANIVRVAGGSGYLTGIRLRTNQVGNTAGYVVHIYKVAQPTSAVEGDNVALTMKYANFAEKVCSVTLPAMRTSTVTGTSDAAETFNFDIRIPFACAAGSRTLYYRVETSTIFTPASAQGYSIEAHAESN